MEVISPAELEIDLTCLQKIKKLNRHRGVQATTLHNNKELIIISEIGNHNTPPGGRLAGLARYFFTFY